MPTSAESAFQFGHTAAGQPLPWEWARTRLVTARNYWIATAGTHGPHLRPYWGVWRTDGLWFSTANRALANAERDPHVSAHPELAEPADEAVIVEGELTRVREFDLLVDVLARYNAKYGGDAEPTEEGMRDSGGAAGAVLLVRPGTVLGWSVDALDRATRWRCEGEVAW
ncbi:MAG TPA: hypothetical protein VGM75_35165 [Pseudonocardiaceae bacterium]